MNFVQDLCEDLYELFKVTLFLMLFSFWLEMACHMSRKMYMFRLYNSKDFKIKELPMLEWVLIFIPHILCLLHFYGNKYSYNI